MSNQKNNKSDWISKYAFNMLDLHQNWQSPLGIDQQYIEHIKEYLETCFDDPLKRSLIETTYSKSA